MGLGSDLSRPDRYPDITLLPMVRIIPPSLMSECVTVLSDLPRGPWGSPPQKTVLLSDTNLVNISSLRSKSRCRVQPPRTHNTMSLNSHVPLLSFTRHTSDRGKCSPARTFTHRQGHTQAHRDLSWVLYPPLCLRTFHWVSSVGCQDQERGEGINPLRSVVLWRVPE